MIDLAGVAIVITGRNGGIGHTCVRSAFIHQTDVELSDRSTEKLSPIAKDFATTVSKVGVINIDDSDSIGFVLKSTQDPKGYHDRLIDADDAMSHNHFRL